MAQYVYVKAVDVPTLTAQVSAVSVGHLVTNVTANGTVVTVTTSRDLIPTERSVLYACVCSHNPTEVIVKNRILAAVVFGQSIIIEVGVENIMLGFTTQQVANMLVNFADVKAMLESGSLYTALAALDAKKPAPDFNKDRITKYANRIRTFLGLPLE